MLTAEILTTGDELLRGDVINTNAAWLATRLKQVGLELTRVVTVGDELEGLVRALEESLPRCDLLLVSGGLGPTSDDRTTEAVARAAGAAPLELDAAALEAMRERFARGGYVLTPNNEKQAWLPRGAEVLRNPRGTAPGFLLRVSREGGRVCRVACLPGVPLELKGIFEEELLPRLRAELSLAPALLRSLNVFGLGESQLDHRLADLLAAVPAGSRGAAQVGRSGVAAATNDCQVTLHYRTSFPENRVIVVVRPGAGGVEEATALLARLEAEARARLGRHVFSVDETTFSEAVVGALRAAGATVALAESCTGGLAGDLITQASGSSEVFELSAVTYSNACKQKLLGVPEAVLASAGAVSRECVEAMARGVRALAGATYGVAISGIAGPGGGSEEKPVGTVHFALASASGVRHLHRVFPFERQRVKQISAYTALAMVLHELRGEWPASGDPLEGRWAAKRT